MNFFVFIETPPTRKERHNNNSIDQWEPNEKKKTINTQTEPRHIKIEQNEEKKYVIIDCFD